MSLSGQVASVLMVSNGWVSLRLPELDEKESDMQRSGRGHSGQRAQQCKGPEVGLFLVCSKNSEGLPWWFHGKESSCQCRGRRFNP